MAKLADKLYDTEPCEHCQHESKLFVKRGNAWHCVKCGSEHKRQRREARVKPVSGSVYDLPLFRRK